MSSLSDVFGVKHYTSTSRPTAEEGMIFVRDYWLVISSDGLVDRLSPETMQCVYGGKFTLIPRRTMDRIKALHEQSLHPEITSERVKELRARIARVVQDAGLFQTSHSSSLKNKQEKK